MKYITLTPEEYHQVLIEFNHQCFFSDSFVKFSVMLKLATDEKIFKLLKNGFVDIREFNIHLKNGLVDLRRKGLSYDRLKN